MKLNNILYVSISLAVLVGTAYADEAVDCAVLGYKNKVKDCPASVGQPLICPTSTALYAEKPCLCLTSSCRDYPLIKDKNGTFYVIGSGGSKKQVNSDWTMYFDGGEDRGLEKCTTGHGEDAVTYYRIIKCKDDPVNDAVPIYNNGLCMTGCSRTIYPYDVHPGNLAGKVEDCQDSKGIYYGYTECNDGWEKNGGRCELHSCQITEYPYTTEPNLINNEKRGEVTSCKVGGNTYYKYTSCSGGFTKKGSVCTKICNINTSCTSKNKGDYKDWTCSFSTSKCRVGDYAAINNNIIGIIVHLSEGSDDKNLIIPDNKDLKLSTFVWGKNGAEVIDVDNTLLPNIPNSAASKEDFSGKKNTYAILRFAGNQGWTKVADYYPAIDYCLTYKPANCNSAFCQVGEWYWPSEGELGYMYDGRYILYNVLSEDPNAISLSTGIYWSSTELSSINAFYLMFASGNRFANLKQLTNYVRPFLAF